MFNVKNETKKIIEFIKNHFRENKIDGIVMGISGGKDSTIASALFVEALGSKNVVGIAMPCESIQSDEDDAKRVADHLGFKLYRLDLTDTYQVFSKELKKSLNLSNYKNPSINLKPRLRMSALYYFAQSLSDNSNKTYVVAGTGNKCEITIGYFTKFGDGASDINILADLTVSEILAIGDYLKLPHDLVHKTPSDGLSGMSDEEKLGFTYDEVEEFLQGTTQHQTISSYFKNSSHKRNPIPIYKKNNSKELAKSIVELVTKRKETISIMESCTSGLLASTITDIKGASQIIKFAAVTYSNEHKIKLGVKKATIDSHTVYSEAVAKEMAKSITDYSDSHYGIGVTGELGNTDEKYFYFAIYNKNKNQFKSYKYYLVANNKETAKNEAVATILNELWRHLNES